jgi:hypothetical protein
LIHQPFEGGCGSAALSRNFKHADFPAGGVDDRTSVQALKPGAQGDEVGGTRQHTTFAP